MPRHDYRCPSCGRELRDQYRPVTEGGSAHPPFCTICQISMVWVVPVVANDLRSDSDDPHFKKFHVWDGDHRIEISSLSQMRTLERETAKKAADGIGQPLVFRAYSQDHSNLSVNTFGDGPSERPTDEAKRRFGQQAMIKSLDEPEGAFGPGVDESNCSALPLPPEPAPAAPSPE